MRFLRVLCVLCGFVVLAQALDRRAFTFVAYDLQVTVTPAEQKLSASGKITLRNDSSAPQKQVVLQLSSTLGFTSIEHAGKPLSFVSQDYVSDIDHTGALTQAVVTLPEEVPPGGTAELDIAYEGTVAADASRLETIGAPESVAQRIEWDRIGADFTAVRGVGHVAWYPIAVEGATLATGEDVFQVLEDFKQRHTRSRMRVFLCVEAEAGAQLATVTNGTRPAQPRGDPAPARCGEHLYDPIGLAVPTFAVGPYQTLAQPVVVVHHLPGREHAARDYADVAAAVLPLITQWFGPARDTLRIADLPDRNSAAFESGAMLFTPLRTTDLNSLQLTLVHQLAHAAFDSPRPWIYEGAAHFAQALLREQQAGRSAALTYMQKQLPAIVEEDKLALAGEAAEPGIEVRQPLIRASDQVLYRSKAMFVWWMLRDLVGDAALQSAFKAYQPQQDTEPSYFQRLLQQPVHRDLEWFFDDWVYRDVGLPDFRVVSAYPRQSLAGTYLVTVTIENLGEAAASVPVSARVAGRDISERVQVAGKSQAVVRIQAPALPTEIVVNDGSVPEFDSSNNVFKMEAAKTSE